MKVLFLHGLESGPHGQKYVALMSAGYDVIAPDMRGLSLADRVLFIKDLLEGIATLPDPELVIVGSSYGGITAVLATQENSLSVKGMVLCAPALERAELPNISPETLTTSIPTVIVHGDMDDVIPLQVSRNFIVRNPHVKLVTVVDDHRLAASSDAILAAVATLV